MNKANLSKEQKLIMHSVSAMLEICGNSYANAYIEEWLRWAREVGAYKGSVIGNIKDLQEEWEQHLDSMGGLPEFDG